MFAIPRYRYAMIDMIQDQERWEQKAKVVVMQMLMVDDEEGLIFVKGNIPGAEGSTVTIKDAVKVAIPPNAPLPAKTRNPQPSQASAGDPVKNSAQGEATDKPTEAN